MRARVSRPRWPPSAPNYRATRPSLAAKLRGVDSAGMLCSAKELGLADTSEGIVELPADAPVGTDLRAYMQLDDEILELNVTPNRGDAMSVLGIAREVGVLRSPAGRRQRRHRSR